MSEDGRAGDRDWAGACCGTYDRGEGVSPRGTGPRVRASPVSGEKVRKPVTHEAIATRATRGARLATRAARGDVDAIPGTRREPADPPRAPRASVPIQRRSGKVSWVLAHPRATLLPGSLAAAPRRWLGRRRVRPRRVHPQAGQGVPGWGRRRRRRLGNQADAVTKGNAAAVLERALDPDGGTGDLDYLQELIAIQAGGPKNVGFFGTRNMGFLHQQLVEILSYALVLTENHIFTSGATGTHAAVIRGALRAERPDLLTVILPQSVSKQPEESRELLKKVENVLELKFDALPLGEASRKCNDDILAKVQQVICFAFHDSNLLLDTCHEAKMQRKLVALFYLD